MNVTDDDVRFVEIEFPGYLGSGATTNCSEPFIHSTYACMFLAVSFLVVFM